MRDDATSPSVQTFNLVDKPWILVHRVDGQVEALSLTETFARAHEVRSVVGEVPTQTFAITRLLLAILHRAVDGPEDLTTWSEMWRAPTLPVEDIAAYLGHVRHRFDLLSTDTPFYQVADLHTAKGEASGLDRLIADVPVNSYFFTTRLASGIDRLSFAEAARWVVHCQAFDPSGIKSGAVGDDRVKGGKGYPIGTGWTGMLGGVLAEGHTLKETLLLNLTPDDQPERSELPDATDDLPTWERDPHGPEQEFPDGYHPAGPLQLYTWQSRRIRLFHDTHGVHGVLICNGDKSTPQNRHVVEPMSVWRRSQAQEKKVGVVPTFMPKMHDPERAVWRGLAALLEDTRGRASGSDAAKELRPAVLHWVETTRARGPIGDDYQIRTRILGMEYGSQSATIVEIIDDAVALPVILLGDAGAELRAAAVGAVADADEAARALGNLAANLAEAAGGDGGGPRDRARELAYAQLDQPYRAWLAGLTPTTSPADARAEWQRAADRIIRDLGGGLVDQAGPVAWRGRETRGRHVSTPEADLWFRRQLRKALAYAYPTEIETEVAA
jgi:CRISPR system Cascade subunit CasA